MARVSGPHCQTVLDPDIANQSLSKQFQGGKKKTFLTKLPTEHFRFKKIKAEA